MAGDLLYLPAYRVRGDPEPLQRLDHRAVTAAGQAEQIVDDQDLPVAAGAGADADCRDFQHLGHARGEFRPS